MLFKQPLRQTEGFMRSIAKLLGVDITVPHFTTMSRRGNWPSLSAKAAASKNANPLHLVVDSNGLKILGEGEWLETKHKTKCKRRSWRKLHLGLDLVSGQIVCSELTTDDIGDPTALPALLEQIEASVDLFLAEGLCQSSVRQDQGEHLSPRCFRQNGLQRRRSSAHRRTLARSEPADDPGGGDLGQGALQTVPRDRPCHRLLPSQIDRARRAGQIAGTREMHGIAQIPCPIGTPRDRHSGLCCAQGNTHQHKVQRTQRGT